jgi:hypothetical protein
MTNGDVTTRDSLRHNGGNLYIIVNHHQKASMTKMNLQKLINP